MINYYEYYKNHGICTRCGSRKARPGKTTCQACNDKSMSAAMKKYNQRKADGLCVKCGINKPETYLMCDSCRDKHKLSIYRKVMKNG